VRLAPKASNPAACLCWLVFNIRNLDRKSSRDQLRSDAGCGAGVWRRSAGHGRWRVAVHQRVRCNYNGANRDVSNSEPVPPRRSLARDFGHSRKWRHFRRLAAKKAVSGKGFWASRAEGREFRHESLLDDFSISEIWERERSDRLRFRGDWFESASR
jgi:hypothetical protein